MTEPIAKSLDDLCPPTFTATLTLPDGRQIGVAVKPLTERQVTEIRQSVAYPEAPILEMTKTGPVRDITDKGYLAGREAADEELARRMFLASLDLEVPGDTTADKLTALETRLSKKVFQQLIAVVNRANYVTDGEIANVARSFRPARKDGAPGDGAAQVDAGAVVGASAY